MSDDRLFGPRRQSPTDDPQVQAQVEALDLEGLLALAEILAREPEISGPLQEGHFTLMRFTHHWKAVFRTPDFPDDYELVRVFSAHPTARDALVHLVLRGGMPTLEQVRAALDSLRFRRPT